MSRVCLCLGVLLVVAPLTAGAQYAPRQVPPVPSQRNLMQLPVDLALEAQRQRALEQARQQTCTTVCNQSGTYCTTTCR